MSLKFLILEKVEALRKDVLELRQGQSKILELLEGLNKPVLLNPESVDRVYDGRNCDGKD